MLTNPNLVNYSNGQLVTNSLLVAEKFRKKHFHVISSIKNLVNSHEKSCQFYALSSYVDDSGKENPMYIMNRDGFSLLVMGFTGKDALNFKLEFIEAFNNMEQKLKDQQNAVPQSFSEALMLAARQAEQIELQQKELKLASPKVQYHDEVLQSKSLIATNVIAKELGMSAVTLNKKLHEMKVIYKSGKSWVLYQKYQEKEYTGTKTHTYIDSLGEECSKVQTYWTEKGRQFIHSLFNSKN